jgi:D-sedoheptulose 7-phosphate isomerase
VDATRGHEVNAAGTGSAVSCVDYARRLQGVLADAEWSNVARLAEDLLACWQEGRQVFLCGNGGSAGNAVHLANDFLYGVSKVKGSGLRAHALSANTAVLTCLANDEGYECIYSVQLAVHARAGDIVIVLSGSGNSPNILEVLKKARSMGVKSYAVLGYSGGKAAQLVDVPIHFPIDDMQIAEDMQLVVGHMVMQWLYQNRPDKGATRG